MLLPWHPALEPSSPPEPHWGFVGAGSTLGWFGDPLCSAKAGKGEEKPFVQDVQWGHGLAWLRTIFLWGNEADFIKQSSALEAGGVFHCSLWVQLALFLYWLQNTPGLVPVWIPPVPL